eukprot:2700960-Prymnesium_polylepis.1
MRNLSRARRARERESSCSKIWKKTALTCGGEGPRWRRVGRLWRFGSGRLQHSRSPDYCTGGPASSAPRSTATAGPSAAFQTATAAG